MGQFMDSQWVEDKKYKNEIKIIHIITLTMKLSHRGIFWWFIYAVREKQLELLTSFASPWKWTIKRQLYIYTESDVLMQPPLRSDTFKPLTQQHIFASKASLQTPPVSHKNLVITTPPKWLDGLSWNFKAFSFRYLVVHLINFLALRPPSLAHTSFSLA